MDKQQKVFDENRKRALTIIEEWLIDLEQETNNESNFSEVTNDKS